MITNSALSQEFSTEQKQYLQGFFAGAAQRGLLPFAGTTAAGLITNDPAQAEAKEELWFGTPVEDLAREERWKLEQNPFEIWDKVLQYAVGNQAPSEDDRFRMKYFGLFHVAPAQDAFMLRLRVPAGILSSAQMRGIAGISEAWGNGRCDLTTRSNVQLRELQPKDVVRVLSRVQALGMSSRGSGADNIRNITASPITGLDRQELLDVAPFAEALQMYINHSRTMVELPRKFNIAFDNGGAISTLADTNDIGFQAVEVGEGRTVPAGIYFRVVLCGITGHRQFASDSGLLLRPDQAVAVAAAMVSVFVEHGDRTDRKKARLKYLVDRWGVAKFLAETEKKLAFPLIRVAAEECKARGPVDRAGHLGVHAQKQAGLRYVGMSVPVGQLSAAQMIALADAADEYGSGEVRLTVWQNLLIPNVPEALIGMLTDAIAEAGLSIDAGSVLSGTVACTGSRGCRFAATDTKAHAVVLANALDRKFPKTGAGGMSLPVNLHVTGCNNSCAQHYIGDVGLMGIKVGGEEGYQVILGGGADGDQAIGRELIAAVKFSELQPKLEGLFAAYVVGRRESETFLAFTRRHEIEVLRDFACAGEMH